MHYFGGDSILWDEIITTARGSFSTAEDVQYSGRIPTVLWRPGGIQSVLWRIFNTVEGNQKHCGDNSQGGFGYTFPVLNIQNSTDGKPIQYLKILHSA